MVDDMEIRAEGFENSKRPVVLLKVRKAWHLFRELIVFYAAQQVLQLIQHSGSKNFNSLQPQLPASGKRTAWINAGGQLVPAARMEQLVTGIETGKVRSWDAVHQFYQKEAAQYNTQKLKHALASVKEIKGWKTIGAAEIKELLQQFLSTKTWMVQGIEQSRTKDYTSPFRTMLYANPAEMEAVTGSLKDNSFIRQQQEELDHYRQQIKKWK